MPTDIEPDGTFVTPQTALGIKWQGYRRLYFDVTTSGAAGDNAAMGLPMAAAAWSSATTSDHVTTTLASGNHQTTCAISPSSAAALSGVLMVYVKGGKRPRQVDSVGDNTIFTTYNQVKFRRRAQRRQLFFYFSEITSDTSYTWTPGIPNLKNVYWMADAVDDYVAFTLSNGVVTLTVPSAVETYTGTMIAEFGQ